MLTKGWAMTLAVAILVACASYVAYADCGKCHQTKTEEGWWCGGCKAAVTPADLKDGKCAKCGGAPEKCVLCIATGYVCEKCKVESAKAGDCEKCKGKLAEKTVKAKVIWACPDCGHEGKSGDKCEKCKKDCAKSCSASGTFPHTSEKKAPK
ncbi:MAG: hypothetical protein HYZ53_30105 [Planctomycetes bacterium]|nr:hypothetical protein [Planctomycetota bacterium]